MRLLLWLLSLSLALPLHAITPTETPTQTPTETPADTPTASPSETPTPPDSPTVSPSFSASPSFTASPTPICPGGGFLGSTSISSTGDGSGYIDGNLWNLPVYGTLNAIQFWVGGGSGQARVAAYSDVSGTPGVLLSQGGPQTVNPGVNSIDVTPVDLSPGPLWIFIQVEPGVILGYQPGGGTEYYQPFSFGPFPSSLSGGGTSNWSIAMLGVVCPLPTPTPTATDSPTGTATPSITQTATPSASPSDTPTATRSRTPSPTASDTGTRTPSPTATPSWTDTPSISPTATVTTSVTPTATPTQALSNGPPDLLAAVPYPNPGARSLRLDLAAPADSVRVRIYSEALVLEEAWDAGPLPQGWSQLALPGDLRPGLHFAALKSRRGDLEGKAPKPVRLYELR